MFVTCTSTASGFNGVLKRPGGGGGSLLFSGSNSWVLEGPKGLDVVEELEEFSNVESRWGWVADVGLAGPCNGLPEVPSAGDAGASASLSGGSGSKFFDWFVT